MVRKFSVKGTPMRTREFCLLPGRLCGFLLAFAIISPSTCAQTTAPNEWTWVGGSSTVVSGGQPGVYGALGTPAPGNIPGSREGATSWTDKNGNLWLFGGLAYSTTSYFGYLNDVWKFNPITNEWAWMGGSNLAPCSGCGAPGAYGTLGAAAAGNIPGGRADAASWTDYNGNLWLFGGLGADASGAFGYLNDLWKFNPSTNQWAWMGGSNTVGAFGGQPGVYGTLGVPALGNIPGSREAATTWIDRSGNLWLFGGVPASFGGFNGAANYEVLNDLWVFNPSINEWTWMGGIDGFSVNGGNPGVYGTLGVPALTNIPGNRGDSSGWTDSGGNLWLFGGTGNSGVYGSEGNLNDVWEFSPSTNEWEWRGGSNTVVCGFLECGQPGVFGTLGTFDASNIPSSRSDAARWADNNGHVWLFGGTGGPPSGNYARLNDLWEFDVLSDSWAWIGGNSSTGSNCTQPDFITGRFTCGQPGVYGTLGTPAAGNNPGARSGAASWTDNAGRFWLFGGSGFDASGNYASLNDLWEYQPYPNAGAPEFSVSSGTYATTQTVTITDATAGATIYYTTDGSTPTPNSTVYSGPITVSSSETIEAIATANGYVASSAATATYTIPPDFSVAATPASSTVTAGQFGNTSISITPANGFNSMVSFSCSGLPYGATCIFAPQTVTPTTGAASTSLNVTTDVAMAAIRRPASPLFPISTLAAVVWCVGWKRRWLVLSLGLIVACVIGFSLLNGCGSGIFRRRHNSPAIGHVHHHRERNLRLTAALHDVLAHSD